MPGPYVRGYHPGIDYACPIGTPVYASADGTVVSVAPNAGEYGNRLILSHGAGVETWYAHLSGFGGMLQGQFVAQGQVVALSGNSGRSSGPHVHAELRIDGEPVDPEPWMEG